MFGWLDRPHREITAQDESDMHCLFITTRHPSQRMARPHVLAAAAMLALAGWAASPSVHAQGSAEGASRPATPARSLRIDLPSQSLSRSIDALARQFGVGIGLDLSLIHI